MRTRPLLPSAPIARRLLLLAGLAALPLRLAGQAGPKSALAPSELIAAVKAKDGPGVSRLLKAGADPSGRDANGMTPLHYAAVAGDMNSAMLLIAAGAGLSAQDPAGMTPLHCAARSGSLPVANLLIVSGADPRTTSRAGLTPSAEAARNHPDKLAEFLRDRELAPPPRIEEPAVPAAPAAPGKPEAPGQSGAPSWPEERKDALPKVSGDPLKRAFEGGSWTDDIQAAQQFARAKRVTVLALFTGSDWCHFCKVLDAQVLSTAAFRQAVQGKYLLLYVDFPRRNKPSPEVREQRELLAQKYGVHGFPTLVVLDRGERELDRIRGFPQGMTAEKYVEAIQNIAR